MTPVTDAPSSSIPEFLDDRSNGAPLSPMSVASESTLIQSPNTTQLLMPSLSYFPTMQPSPSTSKSVLASSISLVGMSPAPSTRALLPKSPEAIHPSPTDTPAELPSSPNPKSTSPLVDIPLSELKPGFVPERAFQVAPKAKNGPREKHSKWILFQLFFTTYRKFFVFVLTLNLVGISLAAAGHFPYAENHTGAILLGNLLTAVLFRNELFLRILYLLTNTLLAKWPPLSIRLGATSALQHVGGIHSGCASSGLAWILYKVVGIIKRRNITAHSVIAMGLVTNIAIIISVASAFPWVRNAHHNIFERYHRFIGWLGVASTWAFVYLGNCYDPATGICTPNVRHLISDQEFWFVLGMTVFICIPWAFTRRVKVDIEIPSTKVAIIRFERGMQQGVLGRISRTTVMEYHAFGIISEGTHAKYHYMVCGVQGDFTKGLVIDPPTHLWTREIKFAGVSNTSKLYKRGIRICTGTGIGAGLSTCLQDDGWFLIWIGSDQLKTFGTTVHNLILNGIPPERRILWDSKKMGGRPDTMTLLEETYRAWNAEVVFITSNDQGNREMMLGCKERGIPAFGTLFDF